MKRCSIDKKEFTKKNPAFEKEREKHRPLSTHKGSIGIIVMLFPMNELLRGQEREGGRKEKGGIFLLAPSGSKIISKSFSHQKIVLRSP